nr:hypothetical protein CFP56_17706 [Quercus suber]
MKASQQGRSIMPQYGWVIWYQGKLVSITDEIILQIRVALTDTLGWCYVELGKAWKNIFSFNSSMHQNEKSPFGSSSLGSNSQPLVEVHHRFTTPVLGGGQRSEQVEKAICSALLR